MRRDHDPPGGYLEPSGGYILFVGTLEPRKNVPGLLAAYARLRARLADCPPLWIGGKGAEHTIAELTARIDREVRPHVRFLGYVEPDARRALYEGARLLALPSHDEGFGLPVLEAMTVGVPVVVSNRGALPEVAGDAGLIADPTDADALADAMARVLSDPAMARELGRRGRIRASGLTWEANALIVRDAYDAAIAEGAR